MPKVLLLANNARMKRLIKHEGNIWELIRISPMPCFGGNSGALVKSDKGKLSNIPLEDILTDPPIN